MSNYYAVTAMFEQNSLRELAGNRSDRFEMTFITEANTYKEALSSTALANDLEYVVVRKVQGPMPTNKGDDYVTE